MNNVALLVPTWDGHLNYFKGFMDSYKKHKTYNSADVVVILAGGGKSF